MKRCLIILSAALLLLPLNARAQEIADPEYHMGGRASANLDWKIVKGLHMEVGEEFRYRNVSETPMSFNTSLGLSYKCFPFLKVGADAILVNQNVHKEGKPAWRNKYKFSGSVMGILETGNWKFSLRERFQVTKKGYEVNLNNQPQTAMYLKSRLKASYQFPHKPWEPYLSVELRQMLNAVDYKSLDGSGVRYDDSYLSRVRLNLGAEWQISRSNILDFYILADYNYDKDIKTKSSGAFKKLTYRQDYMLSFCVAYTFGL